MIIAEIIHESQIPPGMFNLVNGLGNVVGEAMSSHKDIDMMSFTGSTRGGVAVAKASATNVKRVSQELGGKSPNLILDDNSFTTSITNGVIHVMGNSGQSCNAPTRMLVPKSRHDEAITIAKSALEKVKVIKFDLIVLDIMMPGKSGLEFTKENKDKISTPIILLTAKGEASDRIEGLDIGADDYLPKPFEPKELILRINNILNKTKYRNTKRRFKFGKIEIDLNKQFILKNDKSIKINNTEKLILDKMVNSPGKIFKREEIGNLIKIDKERSVDVIITRLRKKIEENPKSPNYLQTIRGEGYVLWIE